MINPELKERAAAKPPKHWRYLVSSDPLVRVARATRASPARAVRLQFPQFLIGIAVALGAVAGIDVGIVMIFKGDTSKVGGRAFRRLRN